MNTKKTLMAPRRSRQERRWAEVGGGDALRRALLAIISTSARHTKRRIRSPGWEGRRSHLRRM